MARSGVLYSDIAKAAEAIKTRGQEPTVDRVRDYLGTGSKSTIAPLLKRWKAGKEQLIDTGNLPNDLIKTVKNLYDAMQEMANDQINQVKADFQSSNAKHHQELMNAQHRIKQLTADNEQLESRLTESEQQNQQAKKELQNLQLRLTKCETQRDEAMTRAIELKEALKESKQENQDIRDHFEHYQNKTAEDRHYEREQFQSSNQQALLQIQQLSQQLQQTEKDKTTLLNEKEEQLNTIQQLQTENITIQQTLSHLEKQLDTTTQEKDKISDQNEQWQQQNQDLQKTENRLIEELASVKKDIEHLKNALIKSNKTTNDANITIDQLNDKVSILGQEKAMIQGQYKQLQASL